VTLIFGFGVADDADESVDFRAVPDKFSGVEFE
jgi:hypothetical protein